jgi:hypothetical protein
VRREPVRDQPDRLPIGRCSRGMERWLGEASLPICKRSGRSLHLTGCGSARGFPVPDQSRRITLPMVRLFGVGASGWGRTYRKVSHTATTLAMVSRMSVRWSGK